MIGFRLLGTLAIVMAFALLCWVLLALFGGQGPPWVSSAQFPLLLALAGALYLAARLLLHGPRSTCPHCGSELSFWQREFSGCPRCSATVPPAKLSLGTLLAIGIVVAIVLRSDLHDLRSSVDEFKKASDSQANEIRELRNAIEELHKGGAGPGK